MALLRDINQPAARHLKNKQLKDTMIGAVFLLSVKDLVIMEKLPLKKQRRGLRVKISYDKVLHITEAEKRIKPKMTVKLR